MVEIYLLFLQHVSFRGDWSFKHEFDDKDGNILGFSQMQNNSSLLNDKWKHQQHFINLSESMSVLLSYECMNKKQTMV